jgi:uncharacterized protein (TIGR03435 family)
MVTVQNERGTRWPFWLLAIWASAFVVSLLRMLASYLYLRGLKKRAIVWPYKLPVMPRSVRLLVSDEIASPMAIGFLDPVVMFPANLREQLTDEELDCVLLHECAHLARYDDWVNVGGRFVGAVLLLHPLVWWILRQIDRDREIACDDWAVSRIGAARSYAESLLRVAELRIGSTSSILAAGILPKPSRLRHRIELLLSRGRRFSAVATRSVAGVTTLILLSLAVAVASAPRWIAFTQKLEFEVTSVKENTTNGDTDWRPFRSGDVFRMRNTRIFMMVNYAYKLTATYQIEGYDKFPESWKWYDVEARVPRGATDDEVRLMVQSLLADRFKFKVRRETKVIPQYEVVVHKDKAKLQRAPAGERPMELTVEGRRLSQPPGTCGISLWHEGARWTCRAVGIDKIVSTVGSELKSPVVDRTGLTGIYDVNVLYIPENRRSDPNAPAGLSFEQALQQELGLRYQKGSGQVEVLVIEHLEKPSEN